jgi:hypothetical protein
VALRGKIQQRELGALLAITRELVATSQHLQVHARDTIARSERVRAQSRDGRSRSGAGRAPLSR